MTIDRTLKNQKYLLATIVMMLFVVYGVLFYQYHYSQKEKESIKREVMYNKVLLMKRKNTSFFNETWSNPGGKVEPGESIEDAVKRELTEELGISVDIVRKLSDFHDYRGGSLFGVYTGFLVTITKGIPEIKEPDKAEGLDYFSFDKLPQPMAPYTLEYLMHL